MADNNKGEVQLIGDNLESLKVLVTDSLDAQLEFAPIYKQLIDKVLIMVNKEEELKSWEAKDLLKLLDLAGKARLAPIEQLTKLIQSIQALQDTSALQDKMENLSKVIQEIKDTKKGIVKQAQEEGIDISKVGDVEEAEVVEDEEEANG